DIAIKYGVIGLPTFIIFKHGEVIATQAGGSRKAQLRSFIEKNI
ncbi:MAG: thiol reductase thioredoxin, partial [Candidatus Magasanikbacteria bacterium]|nr:thiol reductase thioredoxin [Candidatus Magasanikbacteria bacterium]